MIKNGKSTKINYAERAERNYLRRNWPRNQERTLNELVQKLRELVRELVATFSMERINTLKPVSEVMQIEKLRVGETRI